MLTCEKVKKNIYFRLLNEIINDKAWLDSGGNKNTIGLVCHTWYVKRSWDYTVRQNILVDLPADVLDSRESDPSPFYHTPFKMQNCVHADVMYAQTKKSLYIPFKQSNVTLWIACLSPIKKWPDSSGIITDMWPLTFGWIVTIDLWVVAGTSNHWHVINGYHNK